MHFVLVDSKRHLVIAKITLPVEARVDLVTMYTLRVAACVSTWESSARMHLPTSGIDSLKEEVSIDRLKVVFLDDKRQALSSRQGPTIASTPEPTNAANPEKNTTLTNTRTSFLKKT